MLENLKHHFKDKMIYSYETSNQATHYRWFTSKEGQTFAIDTTRVTSQELELLSSLFQVTSEIKLLMNESEQFWYSYLFEQKEVNQNSYAVGHWYRCVFFRFDKELPDLHSFIDVLKEGFFAEVSVIWKSLKEGIILMENPIDNKIEDTVFTDLVEAIASDFYTNLYLYIGSPVQGTNLKRQFTWESKAAETIKTFLPSQKVSHLPEAIPFIMIENVPDVLRRDLSVSVQNLLVEDRELIQTIRVYLECGLNASTASKKLYIHRNTLQYRLEKFHEKTGIDVRTFKGSVAAYLSILVSEYLNN
ncbi:PucR family transcriptional regulator [Cytobacillus sp. FJAT-54145]|uniref:PucR family transcriptional regulator n=1 Tax=Cytobacillus spartinae TaxID=3299023 RepID=A0ABW6KH55_9BACI